MKKILLLLSILFIALGADAQGNLQFNQVKLLSATETVPANKVWKVESIVYSSEIASATAWGSNGYSGTTTSAQIDKITINGNLVTVRKSSSSAANANANSLIWEISYPIWLRPNDIISPSTGVLYINAIEFNIIP
jgi:hypothetical protein